MINILELVRVAPIKEEGLHAEKRAVCPKCGSEDVKLGGTETTLVGGGRGVNHEWTKCDCSACGASFTKESKAGHVWYTAGKEVLAGMPCCFETYVYPCAVCDGKVRRKYTGLDGRDTCVALSWTIENGKVVRRHRTYYTCDKCGAGGETAADYWQPSEEHT